MWQSASPDCVNKYSIFHIIVGKWQAELVTLFYMMDVCNFSYCFIVHLIVKRRIKGKSIYFLYFYIYFNFYSNNYKKSVNYLSVVPANFSGAKKKDK